jgi:hypothetical protein
MTILDPNSSVKKKVKKIKTINVTIENFNSFCKDDQMLSYGKYEEDYYFNMKRLSNILDISERKAKGNHSLSQILIKQDKIFYNILKKKNEHVTYYQNTANKQESLLNKEQTLVILKQYKIASYFLNCLNEMDSSDRESDQEEVEEVILDEMSSEPENEILDKRDSPKKRTVVTCLSNRGKLQIPGIHPIRYGFKNGEKYFSLKSLIDALTGYAQSRLNKSKFIFLLSVIR